LLSHPQLSSPHKRFKSFARTLASVHAETQSCFKTWLAAAADSTADSVHSTIDVGSPLTFGTACELPILRDCKLDAFGASSKSKGRSKPELENLEPRTQDLARFSKSSSQNSISDMVKCLDPGFG